MKLLILIIIPLLICQLVVAGSQNSLSVTTSFDLFYDTVPQQIFFAELEENNKRMKRKIHFNNTNAIRLVKLYNTLHLDNIYKNKLHRNLIDDFLSNFRKKYFKVIVNQLKFGVGKNMSIYSAEYNLYLYPTTDIRECDLINVVF